MVEFHRHINDKPVPECLLRSTHDDMEEAFQMVRNSNGAIELDQALVRVLTNQMNDISMLRLKIKNIDDILDLPQHLSTLVFIAKWFNASEDRKPGQGCACRPLPIAERAKLVSIARDMFQLTWPYIEWEKES